MAAKRSHSGDGGGVVATLYLKSSVSNKKLRDKEENITHTQDKRQVNRILFLRKVKY